MKIRRYILFSSDYEYQLHKVYFYFLSQDNLLYFLTDLFPFCRWWLCVLSVLWWLRSCSSFCWETRFVQIYRIWSYIEYWHTDLTHKFKNYKAHVVVCMIRVCGICQVDWLEAWEIDNEHSRDMLQWTQRRHEPCCN